MIREPSIVILCQRGIHDNHIYRPWLHGKPYDSPCARCGEDAAVKMGNPEKRKPIPLCDCCAQDWHIYTDRVSAATVGTSGELTLDNWAEVFQEFMKEEPIGLRALYGDDGLP